MAAAALLLLCSAAIAAASGSPARPRSAARSLAAASRQAPAPVPSPQAQPQLEVRAELVRVEAAVTDAHGNFVAGLKRENFRILDDGAPQPLAYFSSVEAPALVLVIVETSPAVYLIHSQHLQAAYALLDGLAADDWVALATYDQSLHIVLPFTQDKSALAHALLGLHYNLGMPSLNLYDSLAAAVDSLQAAPGKNTVVLLSTGLDTSAASRWDALAAKLRASDVTIYPIALGGKLREYQGEAADPLTGRTELSFANANRALADMAGLTGGEAFFPREKTDFVKLYRQLAAALRHLYTLGFVPPSHDGRYHPLQVQVLDDQGRLLAPAPAKSKLRYRLSARPGYLAPAP